MKKGWWTFWVPSHVCYSKCLCLLARGGLATDSIRSHPIHATVLLFRHPASGGAAVTSFFSTGCSLLSFITPFFCYLLVSLCSVPTSGRCLFAGACGRYLVVPSRAPPVVCPKRFCKLPLTPRLPCFWALSFACSFACSPRLIVVFFALRL